MKSHAPTEDEAATRLQARFRGMKTRREMNEKKNKGGVKGAVIAAAAVAVAKRRQRHAKLPVTRRGDSATDTLPSPHSQSLASALQTERDQSSRQVSGQASQTQSPKLPLLCSHITQCISTPATHSLRASASGRERPLR